MSLPLAGIKVVDICTVYAGPFAAMMLADQGAEVVKIEPPDGDSARTMTTIPETDVSLSFLTFNRNKRSVVFDITTDPGKEAAYKLIEAADVLIINTRVDGRRRRGFDYETLSKINPRLIYVSITGYGDDGPEANLPGIDIIVQARVGDIGSRTVPGQEPPRHTPLFHFDRDGVGGDARASRARQDRPWPEDRGEPAPDGAHAARAADRARRGHRCPRRGPHGRAALGVPLCRRPLRLEHDRQHPPRLEHAHRHVPDPGADHR